MPSPSPSEETETQRNAPILVVGLGVVATALVVAAVLVPGLGALLAVGLLPTAGAFVAEAGRRTRLLWRCVGPMNLAGAVVAGLAVVAPGGTGARIDTGHALLVMYGAAAAGWLVYLLVPPAVEGLWRSLTQRNLENLAGDREKLREDWGPEVDPSAPET